MPTREPSGDNTCIRLSCCQSAVGLSFLVFTATLITMTVLYTTCKNNADTCVPCHMVRQIQESKARHRFPTRRTTFRTVDFGGKPLDLCCFDNFDGLEVSAVSPTEPARDADAEGHSSSKKDPDSFPEFPFPTGHGKTVPAAHLIMTNAAWSKDVIGNTYSLTGWSADRGDAFLRDFKYSNERLIVQQPGIYFVYSQLLFFKLRPPTARDRPYITYSIYKHNNRTLPPPGYKKLRSGTESRCKDDPVPWQQTSFIGSLVRLDGGDELEVRVTERSAVRADSASSIFGAAYLGMYIS